MNSKRNEKIMLSLTKDEKEQLIKQASQLHLNLSSYIRMKLFSED